MRWWTSLLHPRRIVDEEGREVARALRREDALLIAAAPELQRALEEVRNNVREDSPAMWERVEAALAKSKGEDDDPVHE
jgi:Asp-tRNA(Asn)/Glu-tRNA(Gln) amidotransferase C subunit